MDSLQQMALEILDADPDVLREAREYAARRDNFHGLLETIRLAMGLTRPEMISHLGMTQQNYHQLCQRLKTKSGSVQIKTLRKAAKGLGCEVVVLFVPKSADNFAGIASQYDQRRAGYLRRAWRASREAAGTAQANEESPRL